MSNEAYSRAFGNAYGYETDTWVDQKLVELRTKIATQVLAGLMANPGGGGGFNIEADYAVQMADALTKRLRQV